MCGLAASWIIMFLVCLLASLSAAFIDASLQSLLFTTIFMAGSPLWSLIILEHLLFVTTIIWSKSLRAFIEYYIMFFQFIFVLVRVPPAIVFLSFSFFFSWSMDPNSSSNNFAGTVFFSFNWELRSSRNGQRAAEPNAGMVVRAGLCLDGLPGPGWGRKFQHCRIGVFLWDGCN